MKDKLPVEVTERQLFVRQCRLPTDTVVTRRSPGLVFGNYEPQKSEYVESNRESRDGVEISVKNRDIPIKSGSVAGLQM